MRALITGVTGFLGTELARQCLAAGWHLAGLSRSAAEFAEDMAAITYERVSLTDTDAVRAYVARVAPEVIFHLAASTEPPDDFRRLADVNIDGTLHLLQATHELATRPLVLIVSSSAVYGAPRSSLLPINEQAPFTPATCYAVTKVAQEMLGLMAGARYNLPVIRVRPFNLAGPGQPPKYAFSAFARQLAQIEAGLHPPVLEVGDLAARRDFIDVRDVARACVELAGRGEPGEVYNVCSGVATSIQEGLAMLVASSRLGDRLEIRQNVALLRPAAADVPVQLGDATRLRARTGWVPIYSLRQSLDDLLDGWRQRLHIGGASVWPG